jgi:DNA (cytosine-5)-methyltransferase 1
MKKSKKLKCASFFAGVGGIDIGFEQTRKFEVVYANEIDPYAARTYEENSNVKVDTRDICEVMPEQIPDFDVMLAGFPCTDISIAGKQKGLFNEDGSYTRSGLFFELIRIIHEKHPRVIFLENVKNLVSHNNENMFSLIIDALKKEGYINPRYLVMNACEYGNVPQNRERIYIVAFRNQNDESKFTFPRKIPLTQTIIDVVDFNSKIDSKYYYTGKKYKGDICEKLADAVNDPNTVYQWRRRYVRENKRGIIPTLTANMGTGGHNVPIVLTKYGIRKLTPRECFKAQGFPDTFAFPQGMIDSRLYKQAGNSVCVPVIKRIAQNIYEAII